jgi:23S rRNA pseudouridine2605 synthase
VSLQRIQKLIAESGACSRRKAETLILEGRVRVNGKVVKELGAKADSTRDKIEIDDKQIEFPKKVYLLMNKPDGMITSHSDEEGRPVIYSLLSETRRLVSIGRLDFHTEGAIILTNDGELVHRLSHPSSQIPRIYEVKVKGELDPRQIAAIGEGVLLDDGPTQPVPVEKLRVTERNTWYSMVLTEGRNREVRRIVEAVGATVLKLKRAVFAGLSIDDLPPGEVRPLTPVEILSLYEQAGMLKRGLMSTKLRDEKEEETSSYGIVPFPGKRDKPNRKVAAAKQKGGRGCKPGQKCMVTKPSQAPKLNRLSMWKSSSGNKDEAAEADTRRSVEKSGEEPRRDEKTRARKPLGGKSRDEKQRGERSRGGKPGDSRRKDDKPRSDKPRSDKSRSDKPRSDAPRSDKPRSDKPRSDKPRSEKPEDAPRRDDKTRARKPLGGKRNDKTRSDQARSRKPSSGKPRSKAPKKG